MKQVVQPNSYCIRDVVFKINDTSIHDFYPVPRMIEIKEDIESILICFQLKLVSPSMPYQVGETVLVEYMSAATHEKDVSHRSINTYFQIKCLEWYESQDMPCLKVTLQHNKDL